MGLKTKLSEDNPFSYDRYAFAFENIKDGFQCLDYGCYDGRFIHQVLQNKKNIEYIGLDKNQDIIHKNPYNLNLQLFTNNIPFENNIFDFVSILDVIEHIHKQDKVLLELNRVLKIGGTLVITTPKKNLFSFLDLGNYKFVFPKIHRIFYVFSYSNEEYEYRYIKNPSGLIGDVEKEKAWHQHFSEIEMEDLLTKNGFEIEEFDGSCLFQRVFSLFSIIKLGFLIPKSIRQSDCKIFHSSNLFCKAKKIKDLI